MDIFFFGYSNKAENIVLYPRGHKIKCNNVLLNPDYLAIQSPSTTKPQFLVKNPHHF